MKTETYKYKYDKSEIMRDAHEYYRAQKRMGATFGECLKEAWRDAKWRAKFEEEVARRKAERKAEQEARDAQLRAEAAKARAKYEAELERLGVDAQTYGLMHEYGRPGVYYGD